MNERSLALLGNRRSVALGAIPELTAASFRDSVIGAVREGWRIVALFGTAEGADRLRVLAVLADDERSRLGVTTVVLGDRYEALALDCPQASLFERELAEQCGIIPEGHPWLKPVRCHPADHAPNAWLKRELPNVEYPFHRIEGDEVHEVAVGPVHAGIIEP